MKVVLVAPPFHGRVRGLPLGLAYLAAVLANAGFEVRAMDMTINGVGDDKLVELLHSFQPEVIGISVVCSTYLEGIRVARVCKATLGASVSVVMGGPHVAHSAEIILARHADVDICVIGEAEETICDLMEALSHDPAKIASVRGIAFRDVFGIRLTPSRALMENLDLLPLPSRHLFSMAAYPLAIEVFGIGSPNQVDMTASRGCPYPCEFCSTKEFWQRRYRKRSPENVLMELEHLSQRGFTDICFADDIFTIQRDWVLQLCRLIMESGLRIRWACGTRVDRVDRDLIAAMKAAGCVYVYFGVESGSAEINAMQKKGTETLQVERAYELLRKLGIYSSAALVFGLPGETWDTAKQTIDWVREVLRPDEVWISKAACYPGTALARSFGVTAAAYEHWIDGRSKDGLIYGTGGIYTPFFLRGEVVTRIWEYAQSKLGHLNLVSGDDWA